MIAQAVGVSERTVRRYGKSIGLGQTLPDNRKRWLCKRCGHITDKKSKTVCPNCWHGPFDTFCVEIGSPEYEQFIEENQKQEEAEEPEKEGSRDPSKYKDPEPQDNKDSESQDNEEPEDENETDVMTGEEKSQEFEWECPFCHHQWNGSPDECPKCRKSLQE